MNLTIEALFTGPTFIVAFLIFANANRVNSKANSWLGVFIFCVFLIQLSSLLQKNHFFDTRPGVYDFINLVNYIIAPIFYFSIIYFISPHRKWRLTDNLHFLFAFLMLILTVLAQFVVSNQPKSPDEKKLETTAIIIFIIIYCLQVIPYCIVAYNKINRYQKTLFLYSSNTEAINLNWLKKIVACVLLITALWLCDLIFGFSETSHAFEAVSGIFYFIGVCYIAYHSLRQKEIFPYTKEEKKDIETIIEETETADERKRKLITDEKLDEYKQSLTALMDKEKPYLDYEISLVKLAAQFKTSPHLLSYIINTGFNENFFQFINRYRVKEAKQMILNPNMNHLSLIGIAFEVGFNSKTVFNTTFKKITGKTPSEFKKDPN